MLTPTHTVDSGAISRQVISQDLDHICQHLEQDFQTIAGKSLLITGGAGFLGHYLVQTVAHWNKQADDHRRVRLTVCDNYVRGIPNWLKQLEGGGYIRFVTHDVTHPLPHDIGDFNYVIHAASIASPTYYRKHPIETMDANVNGLRYLLEHCRNSCDRGVRLSGFLFFSSSEIYGDPTPDNIPTPETYRGLVSCTGPRACYDEAKRYGETLCVNFAQQYDLAIKIARPFNNYGPGLKITDGRVIPDFARDVFQAKDIVMLSDGSPSRTFCYVADAIVGYYKILLRGRSGEAYNIGVETPEVSMAQLAERVAEFARDLFDYKGIVVRQSSRDIEYLVDNPNRRCPVITKARTELGYSPSISLDDGLRRLLLWYSDNLLAEEA